MNSSTSKVRDRAIEYAETKNNTRSGAKTESGRYSMMLNSIGAQMLNELGKILNRRRIVE